MRPHEILHLKEGVSKDVVIAAAMFHITCTEDALNQVTAENAFLKKELETLKSLAGRFRGEYRELPDPS